MFKPRNTMQARTLRNQATPAERRLWQFISKSQISGYKFSRQMPVGPYYCDFLCRRHKFVIELDGVSHDFTQDADATRTAYLKSQGYRVLRFSNVDVFGNIEGVIMTIEAALADSPTPIPSHKREGRSE